MELSRPINMLKSSRAISRVNVFSSKILSRMITAEDYSTKQTSQMISEIIKQQ
jgi:hypothetical protein